MVTAALLHKELRANCGSWQWMQGHDHRESPIPLWLVKAVPDWSLPPCQGGGQAWARRPSWYLLATWQALNMSCYCSVPPSQFVKANCVTRPERETLWPFQCCFSLHSWLLAHPSPSLLSRTTQGHLLLLKKIKCNGTYEHFRVRVRFNF